MKKLEAYGMIEDVNCRQDHCKVEVRMKEQDMLQAVLEQEERFLYNTDIIKVVA